MDAIDVARFWSKVEVKDTAQCWPWRGHRNKKGYGHFKLDGRARYAHRLALVIAFGTAIEGVVVRHHCDNPPCCNPYHLAAGSQADNLADMAARGRSTRGERNCNAKLTAEKVIAIRSDPRSARAIAAEFGVDPSNVARIKDGSAWRHVT